MRAEIAKHPAVERIYLNQTAQGFKRGSFFIALISHQADAISHDLRRSRLRMSLVYFPPLDERGDIDAADLDEMGAALAAMFLTPVRIFGGGRAFCVQELSGAPRDGQGYYTLTMICTYSVREKDDSPPTRDVQMEFNTGGTT